MRTSSDYVMTLPYRNIHDRLEADRVIAQLREAKKQKSRVKTMPVYGYENSKFMVQLKERRGRWILRVRGRLGKNSPYRDMYASGNGERPRGEHWRFIQDVRLEHADRVDIYLQFQPNRDI